MELNDSQKWEQKRSEDISSSRSDSREKRERLGGARKIDSLDFCSVNGGPSLSLGALIIARFRSLPASIIRTWNKKDRWSDHASSGSRFEFWFCYLTILFFAVYVKKRSFPTEISSLIVMGKIFRSEKKSPLSSKTFFHHSFAFTEVTKADHIWVRNFPRFAIASTRV